MIEDIKAKAREFLKDKPSGARENNLYQDFLSHLGNEFRNAFREVWLERDKALRAGENGENRVLPEKV